MQLMWGVFCSYFKTSFEMVFFAYPVFIVSRESSHRWPQTPYNLHMNYFIYTSRHYNSTVAYQSHSGLKVNGQLVGYATRFLAVQLKKSWVVAPAHLKSQWLL